MIPPLLLGGKLRDTRDPEKVGIAIAKLRETHPELSAPQRHDLIEEIYHATLYAATASNGNSVGSK